MFLHLKNFTDEHATETLGEKTLLKQCINNVFVENIIKVQITLNEYYFVFLKEGLIITLRKPCQNSPPSLQRPERMYL